MEGRFSPLFYSVGEERRAGGQGVSFFHFHPTVEEKNREVGGRTSEFGRCCSRSGSRSGPDWMGTLGPGSVRMKQSDVDPVLSPPPFGHQDRAAVSSWKYFPRSTNPRLGLGQLEKSEEILEVGATPSGL